MLLVALTGGIACGKSVVARILREKGCYLHSADAVAHELMSPGRPAWKKVAARFGPEILRPDGSVDRARLGKIVFSDPASREFMNQLIHPLVLAELKKTVRRLAREGRTAIFVSEAALTIEAGFDRFFDKIVVLHCPEAVQIRRLRERDGSSEEEARRKIGAQMPVAEKARHADYLIDTSGTLAETIDQTERIYARLAQDAVLKKS